MMYKRIMVFFAAAFVLGGCSTQTTDESVVESSDSVAQSSEEVRTESVSSESMAVESSTATEMSDEEDDDLAQISEEEVAKAEIVTDISQYEELVYAKDTIDLSVYESRLVTDNQGTRVMLFSKDNEQVYKTVYVKNNNWLKVIDLKGDKLLLNEKIK
ncbi:MAG: hypothetical protein WBA84_04435 [Carnobacterium sp.]|uniref:hypothetical protein n=1 Tax=Carnobacterium sp. TaxID=48221 RepID=UPI003C771B6A